MPISDRIMENRKVLYYDAQYTVSISIPSYIKTKSQFPIDLIIDRKDDNAMTHLDFDIDLLGATWGEESSLIHYDPMLHKSKDPQVIRKFAK